jgi:ubiquinone/menaquinone biosynthesis C-methylase UbiE
VAESFKDHFSSVAGNYAAFRPDYPRELFQWLASVSPARSAAWDCATGNGQAAVGLAEYFKTVIGTDASADQIANATPHPKIRYSVVPAEKSGLTAQSMDLITVAQSAHWFDLDRFYSEVRRVLRPGGCVALWCYGVIEFDSRKFRV